MSEIDQLPFESASKVDAELEDRRAQEMAQSKIRLHAALEDEQRQKDNFLWIVPATVLFVVLCRVVFWLILSISVTMP